MPSCVVKWCKNNTVHQLKKNGITFHKFPKEPYWKKQWVKSIRLSRNDMDWTPTKASVVCSAHFEDRHLYITNGGLRRVVKYKTPTKVLKNEKLDENISSPCPSSPEPLRNEWEIPIDQKVTVCANDPLLMKKEVEQKYNPTNLVTNNDKKITNTAASTEHFNMEHMTTTPSCYDISVTLETEPIIKEEPKDDNESIDESDESLLEDSEDSLIVNPSEYQLKKKLKKKTKLTALYKKKIKSLNQKVRRYAIKIQSLKSTILKLRLDKYDDSNVPTQNNVAEDLIRILKRKKSNRSLVYSPCLKYFCEALNDCSPKAYDIVRNAFDLCLPHGKTLSKWKVIQDSRTAEKAQSTTNTCSNTVIEQMTSGSQEA